MTGGCIPARRGRIPAQTPRGDALHNCQKRTTFGDEPIDLNGFDVVVLDYELETSSALAFCRDIGHKPVFAIVVAVSDSGQLR